jgi:membrane-associated protease RseP (regulator of RpoE activity)
MCRRVFVALFLVVALALALGVGAIVGGGVVYALMRTHREPRVVNPQGRQFGPYGEFRDRDERPFIVPEGEFVQGTIVQRVFEDSPASAVGLQQGDAIIAVDGEPVASAGALAETIAEREPGDAITLTVYRFDDVREREVEATLGEHPDQDGKAYLGVTVGGLLRMQRLRDGEWLPGPRFYDRSFDFERRDRFEFLWPPQGGFPGE